MSTETCPKCGLRTNFLGNGHQCAEVDKPKRLPDTATHVNRFQVASETSPRLYITSQQVSDMVWVCSCMAGLRYKWCKHIKVISKAVTGVEAEREGRSFMGKYKVNEGQRGSPEDWTKLVEESLTVKPVGGKRRLKI